MASTSKSRARSASKTAPAKPVRKATAPSAPRGTRAVMTAFTAALRDLPPQDRPAVRAAALKNLATKGTAPKAAPKLGGTNRAKASATPRKTASRSRSRSPVAAASASNGAAAH